MFTIGNTDSRISRAALNSVSSQRIPANATSASTSVGMMRNLSAIDAALTTTENPFSACPLALKMRALTIMKCTRFAMSMAHVSHFRGKTK